MAQSASPTRRDASITSPAPPEAPQAPVQQSFTWTSAEGLALILKILLAWPVTHHPHEYLLLWTAHVLEGKHFIGITATGDGKTCMFYFALIVMIYYAKNGPSPCGRSWLQNPAAVIVLPVTAIEEELAPKLNALNLRTVVVNAQTLADGARALWDCVSSSATRIVVLSPEILTTARFNDLLHGPFGKRVALLCLDEIHLLLTWGVAFRKAFRQIGLLRPRLGAHVQIIGLTASLLPGKEVDDVCASLGLRASELHLERRSNLRGNLVLQRRTMISAINGPAFPELAWMVSHRLKAVCFAKTIAQTWRICSYLWSLLPPGQDRELAVRPYHALNPPEYNAETRRLLSERDGGVFVATTSALSVGVDLPKIDVVIVWGTPEDVNSIIQEPGRAGRGNTECTALGIIYLPKTALDTAMAAVAAEKGIANISFELGSVLAADDLEAMLQKLYHNPPLLTCPCPTCNGRPISGIRHELRDGPALIALAAEERRASAAEGSSVKQKKRRGPTTKAMRALIVEHLSRWREDIWDGLPYESTMHFGPSFLISDSELDSLAVQIFEINTRDKVSDFLRAHGCSLLLEHADSLLAALEKARTEAVALRKAINEAAQAKRAATRAQKAAANASQDPKADLELDSDNAEEPDGSPSSGAQHKETVSSGLNTLPPEIFYASQKIKRPPLKTLNTGESTMTTNKRKMPPPTSGTENAVGTTPKRAKVSPAPIKRNPVRSTRQKK